MAIRFSVQFVLIQAFNSIVVMILLFYFPFVYQNLTYTHGELTPENIPYYDPSLASTKSDRYGLEWWFNALDILRIIPPVLLNFAVLYSVTVGDQALASLFIICASVCSITDTMNALRRGWEWTYCDDYQLCRSEDTTIDPINQNHTFLVMASISVVFLGIDFIYVLIGKLLYTPSKLIERYSDKEY